MKNYNKILIAIIVIFVSFFAFNGKVEAGTSWTFQKSKVISIDGSTASHSCGGMDIADEYIEKGFVIHQNYYNDCSGPSFFTVETKNADLGASITVEYTENGNTHSKTFTSPRTSEDITLKLGGSKNLKGWWVKCESKKSEIVEVRNNNHIIGMSVGTADVICSSSYITGAVTYHVNVEAADTNTGNLSGISIKVGDTGKYEFTNIGTLSVSKCETTSSEHLKITNTYTDGCGYEGIAEGNATIEATLNDASTKLQVSVKIDAATEKTTSNSYYASASIDPTKGTFTSGGNFTVQTSAPAIAIYKGEKATVTLPSVTGKNNNTFDGWVMNSTNCSSKKYSAGSSTTFPAGTKSMTFRACFTDNTTGESGTGDTTVPSNPTVDPSYTIPGSTTTTTVKQNGVIGDDGLCDTYHVEREDTIGIFNNTAKANFNVYAYKANDNCGQGKTYASICIDPTKASPTDKTTYYKIGVINPFDNIDVFPNISNSMVGSKGFEAFVLKVVQEHRKEIVSNTTTRAAAQMAIRAYYFNAGGDPSNIANGASEEDYGKVFQHLAAYFTCEFNIINKDKGYSTSDCTEANMSKWKWTGNDTVIGEAFDIYSTAMIAANKVWNQNDFSDIEKIGFDFMKPDTKDCENDKESDNVIKFIEGQVDGLSSYPSSVKLVEIICPAGVTCRLKIDGNIVATGVKGQKLNVEIPKGSTYRIEVIGTAEQVANATGDLGISIEYFDEKDYHNVIAISPQPEKSVSTIQRMILVNADAPIKADIVLAQIDEIMCKCYVDPTLTPGNAKFDAAAFKANGCCEEAIEKDDRTAVPGGTVIPTVCPEPTDCTSTNMYGVCPEGAEDYTKYYVYEGMDVNGTGKEAYAMCVIDKSDAAGNSYNMKGLEPGSNLYCTVSCKEDWEFYLPGSRSEVRAGSYFLLDIQNVKATRTCVSSIEIKNDVDGSGYFESDIIQNTIELIAAINKYNENAAYVKAWEEAQSSRLTESSTCTYGGNPIASCGGNPLAAGNVNQGYLTEAYEVVNTSSKNYIHYTFENNKFDVHGKIEEKFKIESGTKTAGAKTYGEANPDAHDGCATSCSNNIETPEQQYEKAGFANAMAAAQQEISTLIEKRTEMIEDIIECSEWLNTYEFDPLINYHYGEETYMDQINVNNYFESSTITGPATKETYCTEKADDESFECGENGGTESPGTSWTNIISIPIITGVDASNYSKIVIADDKTTPYNNSIMKTSTYEASYVIKGAWYTLHDSGEMKYSSEGAEGDTKSTVIDENGITTSTSRTGKVFPIRMTTKEGRYDYDFKFSQIGMYNDDSRLGRIMGGAKSPTKISVMSVVKDAEETYKCYYEVVSGLGKCAADDIATEIFSWEDCPAGYNCQRGSGAALDENGNVVFSTRAISVNDLQPNDSIGSNWKTDKGVDTQAAIEAAGESIFETPEYTFTLSANALAKIRSREYDYSNFGLSCDGTTGVLCTSTFIENLESDYGATNVDYTTGRNAHKLYSDNTAWK